MKQITAGIVAFAPVLNCDLTAFREVLLTQQPNEVESDEEEIDDDYADDVEEGFECSVEADSDLCSNGRTQSPDIVLDAIDKLTVDCTEPVSADELRPGVSCWRLPSTMSQGAYEGRNGSNACSLISLLIGHVFYKTKTRFPTQLIGALPDHITAAICVCMEIGNRVYDLCRHNLPSRRHENHTGKGFCSHTRTVLATRFL